METLLGQQGKASGLYQELIASAVDVAVRHRRFVGITGRRGCNDRRTP